MPVLCAVASIAFSSSWRTGAGSSIHAAHAGESNAVAQQIRKLARQISAQQTPQHVHFGARPLPVFGRKCVQRQAPRIPSCVHGLDGGSHRFHAGLVSGDARQIAAAGPAAVAVHDDGDVRGQSARVDGAGEDPILTAGLENLEQVFHLAKLLWYTGSARDRCSACEPVLIAREWWPASVLRHHQS